MTAPQVSQVNDKPDYTKVRGWLLAFGLYAGFSFLNILVQFLFASAAQRELLQRLPVNASRFYIGNIYIGYALSLVYLAQCICIFRRLRVGRTLSLVAFGWKFVYCLAVVPFLGAYIDATIAASVPSGADSATYAKGMSTVVTFSAYFGTILYLSLATAAFLYFLRSERVKQTLIN